MSFFSELKRRNVFKVAAAYIIVGWLIMQAGDTLAPALHLPDWVNSALAFFLILGFPLAMFFAWAFEMTPDGLKKEKDVDRSQSITGFTGQKLNHTIIVLLVVALAYFAWDKFTHDAASHSAEKDIATGLAEPNHPIQQAAAIELDRESNIPDRNSIAVLPFANRSRSEDDAFFSDGIHDDLLTQLAKINDLKVISRTSVMQYRGTEKSIPEIAAELGVSAILEGGIQRAGNRIRINAQLIDVSTDEHVWAEMFDREMTMDNIFEIQTEITRQIVTAVKGELSETEQQALGTVLTQNLAAYEAFLHARAATNRPDYTKDKYMEAQPWAEKAVKLDPQFAEAWALLTEIHSQAAWIGYDNTPERHAAARETLAQATSLNPESAAVKTAQAEFLYRFENDYRAALAMHREAHAIAPGDARVLLLMAITMRRNGLWQEAIDTFEESMRLDPANAFTATQMIDTLTWMNEWERVESLLGDLTLKFPDSQDLKGMQVWIDLLHHGDLASAREQLDLLTPWGGYVYIEAMTHLLTFERNFDEYLVFLDSPAFAESLQYGYVAGLTKGLAYHLLGDKELSRQYLQQQIDHVLTRTPTGNSVDAFQLSNLAESLSLLGEHEKALESSQRAINMIPRETDHLYGAMLEDTHTLILARAGKRDEAIERLLASVDKVEGLTRWELYLSPVWDFFRDDERFNELARPLNLQEARQ